MSMLTKLNLLFSVNHQKSRIEKFKTARRQSRNRSKTMCEIFGDIFRSKPNISARSQKHLHSQTRNT